MTSFDQATFLAYRVQTAQEMGPPQLPTQVALPGAKAAISHAHLLAHQDAGRHEHAIVERVNAKWERDNTTVIAEHQRWASGPYRAAIEQMRADAAEKAAERMRREAAFERILRERDGRDS